MPTSTVTPFGGATLPETPLPFDPTGKLEDTFEGSHPSYVDETTGDVDTFPYGDEPAVEPEPVVVPQAIEPDPVEDEPAE